MVIADGAHNGDSARRLREALLKYFEFGKVVLVVGVSADKNVEDIASELLPPGVDGDIDQVPAHEGR